MKSGPYKKCECQGLKKPLNPDDENKYLIEQEIKVGNPAQNCSIYHPVTCPHRSYTECSAAGGDALVGTVNAHLLTHYIPEAAHSHPDIVVIGADRSDLPTQRRVVVAIGSAHLA
jgi:hypothetical protein